MPRCVVTLGSYQVPDEKARREAAISARLKEGKRDNADTCFLFCKKLSCNYPSQILSIYTYGC